MSNTFKNTLRAAALASATFGAAAAAGIVFSAPAFAATAADKSAVDAAKAAGTVGEQADGYLGYVRGSADAATTAAVTAINAGRADLYRQTAAKSGVTPEAAGQAAAEQVVLPKVPAGQFYKPLDGAWTRK